MRSAAADATVSLSQIGRLRARLVLAQYRDDLLFRKPDPLHRSVLQKAGL